MRPEEYLLLERSLKTVIQAAENQIAGARLRAQMAKPKHLRPAKPKEIRRGAVIWQDRGESDGGPFWTIVAKGPSSGGPNGQYTDDEGHCHRLWSARVEAA
jgi:hypothetical protein